MYTRLSTIPVILQAGRRQQRGFRQRIVVWIAVVVLLAFSCALNCARALDLVFFRGFLRTRVERPLFIVATPRSGTSFLHHLLALDEKHFTHQKLYQTIFPTVLVNRLSKLLAAFESASRIPLSRLVHGVNEKMFRHWEGIHSVRLDAEEEDESLFMVALLSPALYLLVPYLKDAPQFQQLDELASPGLSLVARDYRLTAQRHLYTEQFATGEDGQPRTLLIKNVLLPSRISLTKEAFPDARFVRLVRDPRAAIPSAMSLFYTSWQVHSPQISRQSPETRALRDMFVGHYRRLAEEAAGPDGHNVLTLRFEDLINDPVSAVEKIYAFMGLTLSEEYRTLLTKTCQGPKTFRSEHNYSLADFGLTEEDITRDLSDLMPALGYSLSTFAGSKSAATTSTQAQNVS